MIIEPRHTGEFYTQEVFNVLDVSARVFSMAVLADVDLEAYINQTFQKCRGDEFQLVKTIEHRERTYRLMETSAKMVESESYQVKNRELVVIRTLRWTGKKFVEVV